MRKHDWAVIVIFSVLMMVFTPKLWAQDWQPTVKYRDVVVLMNWTFQMPVPCGEHTNAGACAFLPNKASVTQPGKVCIITHPGFSSKPSTQEFVDLGLLLDGCITAAGTRTLLISFKQGKSDFQATNRYFKALPCGISVAPKVGDRLDRNTARKWGHELTHCWRGKWHG